MLILDMIYLDWIVKIEKSTCTFELSFSCFVLGSKDLGFMYLES